jgi:hypothetical protein
MPEGAALRLEVADAVVGQPINQPPVIQQVIEVFEGEEKNRLFGFDLDPPVVAELLAELPEALGAIHDLAGNALEVNDTRSAKAVAELLYFSKTVAYGLFREHPGLLSDNAGPRVFRALNPDLPPPVVEVKSPKRFFFPFELLRWQDPDETLPDRPADRARLLLGMSAIVRRQVSYTSEAPTRKLENNDGLAVTAFCHPDLRFAEEEVDYLRDSGPLVNLYGPWPGVQGLAEQSAARHIVDSLVQLDARPWKGPSAVLHLACHCDTSGANDRHRYLDIGGGAGVITLSELKAEIQGKGNPELGRPLVFLNACASSTPRGAGRGAFTEFLLDGQFIGVLGTLFDISDEVAAHFARVFYQALISGRSIGEAMYDARWHLMERHGNPLGLLYTFHGNVDLKVDHPHPDLVKLACS